MEMHREWGTREERRGVGGGGVGWGGWETEWGIQDVMRQSTWFVVPFPLPPPPLPPSVTYVSSLTSGTYIPLLFVPSSLHFPFCSNIISPLLFNLSKLQQEYVSFSPFSILLMILLFTLSSRHPHTTSYSFYICLGVSCQHAFHFIPLLHKHLTPSSSAPLSPHPPRPHHRLPPWLAPSLCSAVKLVHWGSRKWGETIEWREV